MTEKTKPIAEVKCGLVTASIWANTSEAVTYYNATFQRLYKQGDQWKRSSSFGSADLLQLAKAADLAHSKIAELTRKP